VVVFRRRAHVDGQSGAIGKAGGAAARAIGDSQSDSHTRLACAKAASNRSRRYEKG